MKGFASSVDLVGLSLDFCSPTPTLNKLLIGNAKSGFCLVGLLKVYVQGRSLALSKTQAFILRIAAQARNVFIRRTKDFCGLRPFL